jgi:tetratricopeptide (TPR) repeat protein
MIIMFLVASVFLFGSKKDRQELYLKAVAEKSLETKMDLLKEYIRKYGQTKDRFVRFIYLNLADTAFRLKNYDEAIQYGEIAIEYAEVDPTNKLRLYFSLANSYQITKKDPEKAIQYAKSIIETCAALIEKVKGSDQEAEKTEQFVKNYNSYYIAPAHRIMASIYYNKGEIRKASDESVAAYKSDKSEKSSKMAFSLAVNLFRKKMVDEAIAATESIFDVEKPDFNQAKLLASAYYKKKNKDKSVVYYEYAYKAKPKLSIAMSIARLVHKAQPQKGLKYFADAYILTKLDKESDAYRFLEQLYFNHIAKDKSPEEKEQGFKEVISAAAARLGVEMKQEETANTSETSDAQE